MPTASHRGPASIWWRPKDARRPRPFRCPPLGFAPSPSRARPSARPRIFFAKNSRVAAWPRRRLLRPVGRPLHWCLFLTIFGGHADCKRRGPDRNRRAAPKRSWRGASFRRPFRPTRPSGESPSACSEMLKKKRRYAPTRRRPLRLVGRCRRPLRAARAQDVPRGP